MQTMSSRTLTRSSLQLSRAAATRQPALRSQFSPATRRWASSSAPKIRYGLRGGLLRWGIAVGGIYWYATQGNKVLAEEPAYITPKLPHAEQEDENLPTVDELHTARKARQTSTGSLDSQNSETVATVGGAAGGLAGGVGDLEDEAEGEGAFNPITGEINWDCPCLGGMANGPCGPEFKEAFSCFVFSKEEPKGVDCVDKFRGMQNCFRQHPEIYGEELEGDEDEDAEPAAAAGVAASEVSAQTADSSAPPSPASNEVRPAQSRTARSVAPSAATLTADDAASGPAHLSALDAPVPASAKAQPQADTSDPHELSAKKLVKNDILTEGEELVPRQWHDTRGANEEKK